MLKVVEGGARAVAQVYAVSCYKEEMKSSGSKQPWGDSCRVPNLRCSEVQTVSVSDAQIKRQPAADSRRKERRLTYGRDENWFERIASGLQSSMRPHNG